MAAGARCVRAGDLPLVSRPASLEHGPRALGPPRGRAAGRQVPVRICWLVVTGLLLAACTGDALDAPIAPTRRPIIAGPVDNGDPAIMELLSFRGNTGARCT